ncbi:MAG: D-amino-acid transaminase [Alphaproteobacteria bacterium]|nr:D-amino-acid transaminase [Alphaproteobacteria bacterium]TAD91927.1 MAG: D-amino-acid transaminase [Alphaproteobacteria bacterium]
MSRVAYVNGRYVPHTEAAVHIEDRGYQFADGIYEVTAVQGGRVIDEEAHFDRLERSLTELRIPVPMGRPALRHITREMLRRNGVVDGLIYMQITRGVARRDHPFPKEGTPPSVVMTAKRVKPHDPKMLQTGVAAITIPDIRWGRCDIKSVSLLPNVLGKQQAREAGAYEAWMIDQNGMVTEGTSTNAWIVTRSGEVVTRALTNAILGGITRKSLMALAAEAQIKIVERSFSAAEARDAAEAFLTSTTGYVLPIVRLDGQPIGDGTPGPMVKRLRELYLQFMASDQHAA